MYNQSSPVYLNVSVAKADGNCAPRAEAIISFYINIIAYLPVNLKKNDDVFDVLAKGRLCFFELKFKNC